MFMWTIEYIFAQICIVIGLVVIGVSGYVKNKKLILYISILNSLVFGIHYLLIGAYVGMSLNILGIIRGIWYYFTENSSSKSKITALVVIIILNVIMGIVAWVSWIDILAITAGICYTYSIWQKSILYYRYDVIFETILWILYNIYYMSIFAIVSQSILLVALVIGLIKYYQSKHKERNMENEANIK